MTYKIFTTFFLALCISTAKAGNGTVGNGGGGSGSGDGDTGKGNPCHIEFDSSEFPQN